MGKNNISHGCNPQIDGGILPDHWGVGPARRDEVSHERNGGYSTARPPPSRHRAIKRSNPYRETSASPTRTRGVTRNPWEDLPTDPAEESRDFTLLMLPTVLP